MPWSVSLSIISIIDTYLHSAYPCLSINILSRSAAITGLGYLEAMLQTSPGFGSLRRYLLATLQPVYRRLGLEEVPVLSTVSRRSEKVSTEAGYCSGGGGELPGPAAAGGGGGAGVQAGGPGVCPAQQRAAGRLADTAGAHPPVYPGSL